MTRASAFLHGAVVLTYAAFFGSLIAALRVCAVPHTVQPLSCAVGTSCSMLRAGDYT